jgi:hypothetical protein
MPSAFAQTRLMSRQPTMASTADALAEPLVAASPLKTGIICQATRPASSNPNRTGNDVF